MVERVPATHRASVAAAIVQPYLLSWVGIAVLALLNYVLTAGSPLLGDTSWRGAARAGGSLWLLALGAPTAVGTGSVGLAPLALTLAIFFATRGFLRKIRILDGWDLAIAGGAGALTALLIRAWSLPATSTLGALVGGAVVAVVAAVSVRPQLHVSRRALRLGREGWRILRPLLVALGLLGIAVTLVAFVAGWGRVSAIQSAYLTGAAGTVFLIALQLLYLPAAPIWALAFISGASFEIGAGTHFSALGSVSAPLPAIPLFGAVPSPASRMVWLPVLLVVLGLAWGLLEARRGVRLRDTWAPILSAVLLLALLAATAGLLASGGIGPGRMAIIGVRPPIFAGLILLETAVPLLLVLVVAELLDWRAARSWAHDDAEGDEASGAVDAEGVSTEGDEAPAHDDEPAPEHDEAAFTAGPHPAPDASEGTEH